MSGSKLFDSIIFSALQGSQPSGALPGGREGARGTGPTSLPGLRISQGRAPVPRARRAAARLPATPVGVPGSRPARRPRPAGLRGKGCARERRAQAPPGGVSAPQGGVWWGRGRGRPGGRRRAPASSACGWVAVGQLKKSRRGVSPNLSELWARARGAERERRRLPGDAGLEPGR